MNANRHQVPFNQVSTSPTGEPQILLEAEVLYNGDEQDALRFVVDKETLLGLFEPRLTQALAGCVSGEMEFLVPIPTEDDEFTDVSYRNVKARSGIQVQGRIRGAAEENEIVVIDLDLFVARLCVICNLPSDDDAQTVRVYVKPYRSSHQRHR